MAVAVDVARGDRPGTPHRDDSRRGQSRRRAREPHHAPDAVGATVDEGDVREAVPVEVAGRGVESRVRSGGAVERAGPGGAAGQPDVPGTAAARARREHVRPAVAVEVTDGDRGTEPRPGGRDTRGRVGEPRTQTRSVQDGDGPAVGVAARVVLAGGADHEVGTAVPVHVAPCGRGTEAVARLGGTGHPRAVLGERHPRGDGGSVGTARDDGHASGGARRLRGADDQGGDAAAVAAGDGRGVLGTGRVPGGQRSGEAVRAPVT
ncbi:hypothetical protein GCM10022207_06360 [Streptomyces lannensis]|uniref:Uncharacterized protein n=1 Tax=Streptomyces lannensis TaxID=766498 RepID=A0ABP7JLB7_9ACTN